jgi:hypothetical protein
MSNGTDSGGVVVPCPSCMKEAGLDAIADLVADTLKASPAEKLEEIITIGKRARDKHIYGETLPDGFRLREQYNLKCPYCKAVFIMRPGLSLQMGRNSGHGRCLGCEKLFHIQIDTTNNEAVGLAWDTPGA